MAEKHRTPDPEEAIPGATETPVGVTVTREAGVDASRAEQDEPDPEATERMSVENDETSPRETPSEAEIVELSAALVDDPLLGRLSTQLADTEARLRAVSAAYRELQGEIVSIRQRTERLQEERDRVRRGEIVMGIFEPVQNLKRSLAAITAMDLPEEVPEGLRMIVSQFMAALKKLGLEEIVGLGEPFDPNVHEALAVVSVTDASQEGIVLQVYESGWRIGSQVIQPARVIIGAFHEPEA
jgi:molecular chaperone GrpE